jgi:hypothetical protein
MRLKIDLDAETTDRLLDSAMRARRPIHWQAEILLRQVLGLPLCNRCLGPCITSSPLPVPEQGETSAPAPTSQARDTGPQSQKREVRA